jgi:hypothetical protein
MNGRQRLQKLEASAIPPRNIPDSEVEFHCDACLGPGAYRRRIDWAKLFAAGWDGISSSVPPDETPAEREARRAGWRQEVEEARAQFVCSGCGARRETIDGTVLRVRREAAGRRLDEGRPSRE